MKPIGILIAPLLIAILKCGSPNFMIDAYSFKTQPTDTQVKSGMTGELKCVFADAIDATACFWSKDNIPIAIHDRYQYKGTPSSGDCSITISLSNMDTDDAEWICGMPGSSGNNKAGIKSEPAKYSVLSAPTNPIIKENGVEVRNGSEVKITDFQYPPKFECKSEHGNPAAELQFILESSNRYLNGNYTIINETMTGNKTQTAILQLTDNIDVTWRDQNLTCKATHLAYNDTNVYVYITIRNPYNPTNVQLTSSGGSGVIEADSHEYITLYCQADGYPIPTLSWFKRISEENDWVAYKSYNNGTGTANTTFEATNLQWLCRASSDGITTFDSNILTIDIKDVTSSAQLGIIIAIAVACVVFLVLLGVGICLCCRRKKTPAPTTATRQPSNGDNNPSKKRYKSNYPAYSYVNNANRNTNVQELDANSDA